MSGKVIVVSKVEIPVYVAKYIEKCKSEDNTLYTALDELQDRSPFDFSKEVKQIDKVSDWLWDGSGDETFSKFARAWLDGYRVEAEKTFKLRLDSTVVVPNERYLNKNIGAGYYFISDGSETSNVQTLFTEEDVKDLDLTGFVREVQLPF